MARWIGGQANGWPGRAPGLGLILAVLALAAACDKTIDPAAGEATIRMTLPGSSSHGARLEQRWQQCVETNPVSLCDRRFPGGRPFGHPAPSPDAPAPTPDSPPEP